MLAAVLLGVLSVAVLVVLVVELLVVLSDVVVLETVLVDGLDAGAEVGAAIVLAAGLGRVDAVVEDDVADEWAETTSLV